MNTLKTKHLFWLLTPLLGLVLINESIYKLIRLAARIAGGSDYITIVYIARETGLTGIMLASACLFLLASKPPSLKTYKTLYVIASAWPAIRFILIMSQLSSPIMAKDQAYYIIMTRELFFIAVAVFILTHIKYLPAIIGALRRKLSNPTEHNI